MLDYIILFLPLNNLW